MNEGLRLLALDVACEAAEGCGTPAVRRAVQVLQAALDSELSLRPRSDMAPERERLAAARWLACDALQQRAKADWLAELE